MCKVVFCTYIHVFHVAALKKVAMTGVATGSGALLREVTLLRKLTNFGDPAPTRWTTSASL